MGDSILHSQELMELDKISKDMQELNIILNQLGLTDMNWTFNLTTAKYTFFSSAHGTFCRIYYKLGNKRSLNRFCKRKQNGVNIDKSKLKWSQWAIKEIGYMHIPFSETIRRKLNFILPKHKHLDKYLLSATKWTFCLVNSFNNQQCTA